MSAEEAPKLEGLQIWLPSDSFKLNYNLVSFEEAMSGFTALNVLHRPDDDAIYCGGNNRVIYHQVAEAGIQKRLEQLQQHPSRIMSALQPNQRVDHQDFPEEARVRELHLGLGRTTIFLAINAEQARDFTAATKDLKRVFSMLTRPIHSIDELTQTSIRSEGLIYMIVQAARKHKTLTRESATELAEAIDRGILPMSKATHGSRTESGPTETWMQARGHGFIERVSFAYKSPKHTKKASQPKRKTRKKNEYVVNVEKPMREPKVVEKKPPAETFIFRLTGDRRQQPYSDKLADAHETFLGEARKPFNIRGDTKLEMTKLGIESYLEAVSKSELDTAGQILKYLTRKRGYYRYGPLPILVAGNLLTAKVNARGGFYGEQAELPNLTTTGLAASFQAIRYAVEGIGSNERNIDHERLGDIVEAYVQAAYPEAEEQSYEIQNAPEGVVHVANFAADHDIDLITLENAFDEYGINVNPYKFGRRMGKGLTPIDQELLESVIDEIRVERAPEGYVSISSFAHVRRVAKPVVDQLIKKHGVETGLHRFGSKPGKSLSPEAQEQLEKHLFY